MSNLGVFDILGPIMVGPSSSHTAGAARLGKVARAIAGEEIVDVTFLLHGSFGKTYKGHGTDRALAAGIMDMDPADDRLRNSLEIAEERGIKITFKEFDLGDAHPNTVKIIMTTKSGNKCEVVGSSIGGGAIEVVEINGNKLKFTGAYTTIITYHKDIPGTVAKVTNLIYEHKINIAFMNLVRSQKGKDASMTFEIDGEIPNGVIESIENIDGINEVITINPVKEGE